MEEAFSIWQSLGVVRCKWVLAKQSRTPYSLTKALSPKINGRAEEEGNTFAGDKVASKAHMEEGPDPFFVRLKII